jgi:hypothetical protein
VVTQCTSTAGETNVFDAIYIIATIAFFALMVAYVVGLNRLGEVPADEKESL